MTTPPIPPIDDEDTGDLGRTRYQPPQTQPLPPPPPPPPGSRGHVRQNLPERRDRRARDKRRTGDVPRATVDVPAIPDAPGTLPPRPLRKRHERSKADSGLFLPAWSVALMLVVVFGIAASIVALVVMLGGQVRPGGEPRVVIVTAPPSDTPLAGAQNNALPTLPSFSGQANAQGTFALEGPALPTIALTPTPQRIDVGSIIEIVNVGEARLNVRGGAGTDNAVEFQASEGDTFLVIGGPESSGDLTWWNLQSTTNSSTTGWAVQNDGEQDVMRVLPATQVPPPLPTGGPTPLPGV